MIICVGITWRGGGEKCLRALSMIFPGKLFTLLQDPEWDEAIRFGQTSQLIPLSSRIC